MGNTKPQDKSPGTEEAAGHRGRSAAGEVEPDLESAFADDGVDLTLIHWMLRLSPAERLQAAQDLIDTAWVLRTHSEA